MTINGGQPHAVGYAGQEWKVTVIDADLGRRRIVCWSDKPAPVEVLLSLETRPSWSEARNEAVIDRKTGDADPAP